MSILWLIAICIPSESNRKIASLGWIILCVIIGRGYYLYLMLTDKMLDHVCHEKTVQEINEAGIAEEITVDECKYGGETSLWFDLIIGWLFDIYFATVIMRWAKSADDWSRY